METETRNDIRLALAGKLAELITAHSEAVRLVEPCLQTARHYAPELNHNLTLSYYGLPAAELPICRARRILAGSAGPLTRDDAEILTAFAGDVSSAGMNCIEFVGGFSGVRPAIPPDSGERPSVLMRLKVEAIAALWPDAEW